MTGVQTCALPICFPVTITRGVGKADHFGDVGENERVGGAGLGVEHAEGDVVDAFGDRVDVGGRQNLAVCECL